MSIVCESDRVVMASLAEAWGRLPEVSMALAVGGVEDAVETAGRVRAMVPGEEVLAQAEAVGARLVLRGDEEWPERLGMSGAPLGLWVRGDLAVLSGAVVVVSGTRAATAYGRRCAEDVAACLARRGVNVTTGGGFGVEEAAVRSVLAEGEGVSAPGRAVVLPACGLDVARSRARAWLLDEGVESGGVVLSPFAPGQSVSRSRLVRRGALLADLSDAVVIAEAGIHSGARLLAYNARDRGRAVGAVPGPVTSVASAGCNDLLRDPGVQVVTCARTLWRCWPEGLVDRVRGLPPLGPRTLPTRPVTRAVPRRRRTP